MDCISLIISLVFKTFISAETYWCHDTHHNDTQPNYIQHNDTQHNYIQHNDTQHKELNYNTQNTWHA